MSLSWLAPFEQDPGITDLCFGAHSGVFVDRGQGMEPWLRPADHSIREEDIRNWVMTQLARAGKSWDAKFPFADAVLEGGYRLHVAFPPVAKDGILVSVRRLSGRATLETAQNPGQAARLRWKDSAAAYEILAGAVRNGETVLVSGATGSGKTTLATDLLGEVPSNERILALEDTPELCPAHPQFISLISRPPNADGFGEVTLRMLLRQTLRMRPDRIVLGECRGAEVLELLQALNTGHRGGLATLHANSARDALRRVELLCLLHGGGVLPIHSLRELLACGVSWIAHVRREGAGRRIAELRKIEGREGDTILLRAVLDLKNQGNMLANA